MAFSPNGEYLAIESTNGMLYIIDVRLKKSRKILDKIDKGISIKIIINIYYKIMQSVS